MHVPWFLPCCVFTGLAEVRYVNDEQYKWQHAPLDHFQGQATPSRLPTHNHTPDTFTSLISPFLSSCNTTRTSSECRYLPRCGARKQLDGIILSRHHDSAVRADIRDYNCTVTVAVVIKVSYWCIDRTANELYVLFTLTALGRALSHARNSTVLTHERRETWWFRNMVRGSTLCDR